MSDPRLTTPKAIENWWCENETYRDGFSRLMKLAHLLTFIALALTTALFFFIYTNDAEDGYYVELIDGRKRPMVGLHSPNMGITTLADWATYATTGIMTFGFNNHEERFALAVQKFTPKGWETFREGMILSGLVAGVVEARQIVTAVPNGPAVLTKEGIIDGAYTFVFDVPILITFRAGRTQLHLRKTVTMNIQKVPTRQNPEGIAISLWNIQ